MGRRLPWKRNTESGSAPNSVKEAEDKKPSRPVEPRKAAPTPPNKRTYTRSKILSERVRSPSTSPPPEPPPESFMIQGTMNDDRYRMVEDEFLSTAQLFTAHLHRAEYDRLRRQAEQQNAAAIREIDRPVVGSPKGLARLRREAFRRTQRQREQLRREAGEEGDETATASPSPTPPHRMSTGLLGLMDTPVPERSSQPLPLAVSATRAAAGFGSGNTSPTVASHRASTLPVQRRILGSAKDMHNIGHVDESDDDVQLSSSVVMRGTTGKPSTKTTVAKPARQSVHLVEDDDDEDDPFGIQQRRMRREKSREQLRKTAKPTPKPTDSPDVIPTFW